MIRTSSIETVPVRVYEMFNAVVPILVGRENEGHAIWSAL
jgi:hypothetical protein